jgi:Flp pilus assembly protein TadD
MLALIALALLAALFFGVIGASGNVRAWLVDAGQQFGLVEGTPGQTLAGIEAYRAGDVARAERELAEAARAYPRSGVALIYLAQIRADAGDHARALEHLREAVAREPDNAVAHRELAGVHLTRARHLRERSASELAIADELVGAERHFQRALALAPSDRRARGYYGCALADLGRDAEARRALAQAGPGPWDACAGAPGS